MRKNNYIDKPVTCDHKKGLGNNTYVSMAKKC